MFPTGKIEEYFYTILPCIIFHTSMKTGPKGRRILVSTNLTSSCHRKQVCDLFKNNISLSISGKLIKDNGKEPIMPGSLFIEYQGPRIPNKLTGTGVLS